MQQLFEWNCSLLTVIDTFFTQVKTIVHCIIFKGELNPKFLLTLEWFAFGRLQAILVLVDAWL